MGKWRTEQLEMSIHYTTDGDIVGRIVGGSAGVLDKSGEPVNTLTSPDSKDVLIAYLEDFHGLELNPINRGALIRTIDEAVTRFLKER